jgi:phage-related protein
MKSEVEKNGGGIKGFRKTSAEGWKQFIVGAWEKADEKTGGALSNMLSTVTSEAGKIKDKIEEKIGAAVDFIKGLPEQALQWGKDLVANFIDGIKNAPSNIASAASGVAQGIADFLHFSEPDKGPLKDFHTFAPDMIKLFAQGMEQTLPVLERASADVASALVPGAMQNGGTSTTYNTPVNITVYGAQGQDVNALADVIQARLNRAVINQKAVFA